MTAEAAVALPALVVVLAAGVWGLGAGSMQARCATAARSAALAAARGEPDGAIAAHVRAALGSDAAVAVSRSGASVAARVSARTPAVGLLPAMPLSAVATAQLEPVDAP
ncbi:MAG: TadE family type IV pilus minor pilin [Rubrivivax sp.]